MSVTVKTGVAIGLACVAWTFVMGFTGWATDPVLLYLFWFVVIIEVGLLIRGMLQLPAAQPFSRQLGAGVAMAAIAAAIIFVGSYVFTSVVFPHYFEQLRTVQAQMLRSAGKDEAEIASTIAATAKLQTPFINALSGAVGTIFTGVLTALGVAAIRRALATRRESSV